MPQFPRTAARAFGAGTAVLVLAAALCVGTVSAAHADEVSVTDYAGLQDALFPLTPLTGPRTIVLGADIVASASGALLVAGDAAITLDLNGHDLDLDGAADDLTGSIRLDADADFTITDTTATPGTLTAAGAPGFAGIRTTSAALTITGAAIVVARGGGWSIDETNALGGGAGIGGDANGQAGGSLTVSGTADVTAVGGGIDAGGNNYAGAGAGIGGGGGGHNGAEYIPGGPGGLVVIQERARVDASGGDTAAVGSATGGGGAGIGGGGGATSSQAGAGGTVAIEGIAEVRALGGSVDGEYLVAGGGAGIGAGGTPETLLGPVTGGAASVFVLAALTADAGIGNATRTAPPATITETLPEITAVSPATGIPGDALTITGWGLSFATAVTVGGVAASVAVTDDSELAATVPAGSGTGLAVAVTVSAPGGTPTYTVTAPDAFSYQIPPVVGDVVAVVPYDSPGTAVAPEVTSADPPVISVAVVDGASHGAVTVVGLGFEYTPTPGYSGPDSFTYTASNRAGASGTATVTLTVDSAVLAVMPTELPAATVGVPYSQTLTTTGGVAPYRYLVTAGALPDGIVLGLDGVLAGSPTAAGPFSFTVTVEDSGTGTSSTTTAEYSLAVETAPALGGTGAEPPLGAGVLALILLIGGALLGLRSRRGGRRSRTV